MKWQHDGKRLSTKSMQLSVLSFLRPFWTYCRQTATKIVFYKRWHTKSSQFHNLKIMPVSAPKGTAPSHLNVCWPVALTSQGVEVLFSYLSAICIPTKSDSRWCRAHSQKWMSCEDQALLQCIHHLQTAAIEGDTATDDWAVLCLMLMGSSGKHNRWAKGGVQSTRGWFCWLVWEKSKCKQH